LNIKEPSLVAATSFWNVSRGVENGMREVSGQRLAAGLGGLGNHSTKAGIKAVML